MGSFVEARNKNHNRFQKTLKDHLWVQKSDTEVVSSLGFGLMTEDRETVVKALTENEIECRPLICGSIQEHPFWTLTNKFEKSYLPNADKVHKNGLYVPCHQSMTNKEVDFICQILLATK